jgi:hypothetical protein
VFWRVYLLGGGGDDDEESRREIGRPSRRGGVVARALCIIIADYCAQPAAIDHTPTQSASCALAWVSRDADERLGAPDKLPNRFSRAAAVSHCTTEGRPSRA